jgi:hypothetical protein
MNKKGCAQVPCGQASIDLGVHPISRFLLLPRSSMESGPTCRDNDRSFRALWKRDSCSTMHAPHRPRSFLAFSPAKRRRRDLTVPASEAHASSSLDLRRRRRRAVMMRAPVVGLPAPSGGRAGTRSCPRARDAWVAAAGRQVVRGTRRA